jgi:hypothetical protein
MLKRNHERVKTIVMGLESRHARCSKGEQALAAACCRSRPHYALHDGSPDSKSPANLQDAHAFGPELEYARFDDIAQLRVRRPVIKPSQPNHDRFDRFRRTR